MGIDWKLIFKASLLAVLLLLPSGAVAQSFGDKLADEALARTRHFVIYNGAYYSIPYPMGDVPSYIGVCADVVVRSYRAVGIDLQQLVHEDMKANFSLYPTTWGLKKPDTNIDHRRVLNLEVFFARHGQNLPISHNKADYKPGDIVSWNLRDRGRLPHIGIVAKEKARDGTPLIIHNIGRGPELDNILFDYKITGHFRYDGE